MSTQAQILASTAEASAPPGAPSLSRIHLLLLAQTIVVILVSVNRLTPITTGYVAANEFLRWVDFNNMLILPLISTVAFYLLKKQLEYDSLAREGHCHLALNLTFIIGIYLLAASYGNHEVTNYLPNVIKLTDRFVGHSKPFGFKRLFAGVLSTRANGFNEVGHGLPQLT